MKHKATILTAAAALWLAGLGVGAAQDFRPPQAGYDSLPPFEILTIVRSLGLDPLGRPVRRGAAYVLRAADESGQEMRVVVDARSGRVRSAVPVIPAAAWRERPGFGDDARLLPRDGYSERNIPGWRADPGADDETALPPPGAAPRVIRAPQAVDGAPSRAGSPGGRSVIRSAAIVPAHPPVPRPRPATPVSEKTQGGTTAPEKNPDPVNPLW